MATLLFKSTIADWYASIGVIPSSVTEKLLLEILNQAYSSAMVTGSIALPFTTDGTSTYVNTALIGKTISGIFISSMLQTSEYSFDNTTGTITWTATPDTGINGLILYS